MTMRSTVMQNDGVVSYFIVKLQQFASQIKETL